RNVRSMEGRGNHLLPSLGYPLLHAHPHRYIREGGTMPVVPFLESALGAPAIKIPISQATDGSALQNERLGWSHLIKGKDVIRDFIKALGDGSRSC
ncbi:unnamed protein product, partial [Closterium sp. NIES-53]